MGTSHGRTETVRFAAAVLLAGSALACTLLTGVSDLNEVDGGARDVSIDARPKGDARHVDALAKEGSSSNPDASEGFCASQSPAPTFCSDFDTIPSPPWGWDSIQTSLDGGSPLALDDHIYESRPYALLATTPEEPGSAGYLSAYVQKTFAEPIGDSVITFDYYIQTLDPEAQYADLMTLVLGGQSPPWQLNFEVFSASTLGVGVADPDAAAEGGYEYGGYFLGDAGTLETGQWVHVEVDTFRADGGTGIGEFQVLLDGEVVVPKSEVNSSAAFGPPTLQVGLTGSNVPAGPWAVLIDNVTFDMK